MRKHIRAHRAAFHRGTSVAEWGVSFAKTLPVTRSPPGIQYLDNAARNADIRRRRIRSPRFAPHSNVGFNHGSSRDLSRHDVMKDWKSGFCPPPPRLEKDSPESEGVKERGSGRLVPELLRGNIVRRK